MPPAVIRRPLTVAAWTVLSIVCLALSPLLWLAGELGAAITGRPQPRLLARFVIAYCFYELTTLTGCAGLWLLSGFGIGIGGTRMQRVHWRLLAWFIHGGAERITTLAAIEVDPTEPPEVTRALTDPRPLLFLSRHAGPGDTVLLLDLLMQRYNRLPSVVFKETLAIDPVVDVIGHRLPHAVIDTSDPEECVARIASVSAALPACGTLVLFPEGGNINVDRRRRALRKLWGKGRRREARAAERMAHVMPPHPTGVLAAVRGNPGLDVVFSAHTGLGLAAFPRELWREPPLGQTLRTRMWLAPAGERPSGETELTEWLYGWWARIDAWLEDEGEPAPGPTAAS